MDTVKFAVFSSLFSGRQYGINGDERLDKIISDAKENGVEFIIDLGNFCIDPLYNKDEYDLIEKYNKSEIPTYHVLGEYDLLNTVLKEATELYNMPNEYYFFDKNGFRFICLNSNYFRYEGCDVPYSHQFDFNEFVAIHNTKHLHLPKDREVTLEEFGPYQNYIPKAQVEWLKETIDSSEYPVIIFCYTNLYMNEEKNINSIFNRDEIQDIINNANKNGKKILMCINGQNNIDDIFVSDNVCYFQVNSASLFKLKEDNLLYPDEFKRKPYLERKKSLIYNDPLYAIVTVSSDGNITIEGQESSFWLDIDKKDVDGDDFYMSYKVTPKISSKNIKL